MAECRVKLYYIDQQNNTKSIRISIIDTDVVDNYYVTQTLFPKTLTYTAGNIKLWIEVDSSAFEYDNMIAKTNSVTYKIKPHFGNLCEADDDVIYF